MKKSNLFKREYLRGIIMGQNIKLSRNYSAEELNQIYKKYIKDNPSVKDDIKKYDKTKV